MGFELLKWEMKCDTRTPKGLMIRKHDTVNYCCIVFKYMKVSNHRTNILKTHTQLNGVLEHLTFLQGVGILLVEDTCNALRESMLRRVLDNLRSQRS